MKPLAEVLKATILEALVESGYSVERAAKGLDVSRSTMYRKLRRWGLCAPMAGGGGSVPRRDYVRRCDAIQKEASEMSKRKEAPNSYIDDRDQTAGRNNENAELKKLDRQYQSDKAREGTNSGRGSFVGTYDKGKRY